MPSTSTRLATRVRLPPTCVPPRRKPTARQHERALRLAERGLELAQEQWVQLALSCLRGEVLRALGQTEASVQTFEAAVALADDPPQRARALLGLASSLRILDRHREALAAVDAAEEQASGRAEAAELAQIHFLRGNLYFPLGEIDACLAAHERARAYAAEAASPTLEARALGSLGDAHYLRGEMQTAHDYFARSTALARDHGLVSVEATGLPMLAATQFYRLEFEEALENCRLARDRARRAGNLRAGLVALVVSGQVHAYRAEWDSAIAEAEEALVMARRVGARRFEVDALGVLGPRTVRNGTAHRSGTYAGAGLRRRREQPGCAIAAHGCWRALALATRDAHQARLARSPKANGCWPRAVSATLICIFYDFGIECALEQGDADRVQRYAQALLDYTAREPVPFADFHSRAACCWRASCAANARPSCKRELAALAEEARARQLLAALPADRVRARRPPGRGGAVR